MHVEETDYGRRKYTLTKANIREYVDCSNTLCYNGGCSIGIILHRMVREKQTEFETSELCQGNEASAKGRRIYRKCYNFFKIKVSIKYKEVSSKKEEG